MTKPELLWRIRRSTLELDVLLSRFVEHVYDQLSIEERELFQKWVLLEDCDWQGLLKIDHPLVEKILYCQSEIGIL